jgi:hypothetical protein
MPKKELLAIGVLLVLGAGGYFVFTRAGAPQDTETIVELAPGAMLGTSSSPVASGGSGQSAPGAGVLLDSIKIRSLVHDEKALAEALNKLGVKSAMQALVTESGGGSIVDCHQEAHTIGRIGYDIYKEKTFQACDASCHSGCYHGAMEKFLNEKGTENLARNIDSVCTLFDTNFGTFECLHGVGHGVLAYLDYDLPEALNECKKLGDGFKTSSCYGGLFMENILTGQGLGASEDVHETRWVNRTDPHFPCNKISTEYEVQFQCYQMQTSWMLTISNYNFDSVAKDCLNAPDNMINVCFKSFGRDAAGNTLRDPAGIIDICAKVPAGKDHDANYDQCIVGAVNVIIDFWGPGLKGQATELCKITPGASKNTCYSTLAGRLLGIFNTPEPKRAICETFEPDYKKLCTF